MSTEKKKQTSNQCAAMKYYRSRIVAWQTMKESDTDVYIVYTNTNGKIKEELISRCKGSCLTGKNICKNHKDVAEKILMKSVISNFTQDIVYPPKNGDKTFTKATTESIIFDKMGIQGNTKKIHSAIYDFENKEHPILKVLKGRDPRHVNELLLKANEIINKNNKYSKNNDTEVKDNSKPIQSNRLADTLKRVKEEYEKNKKIEDKINENNDDISVLSEKSINEEMESDHELINKESDKIVSNSDNESDNESDNKEIIDDSDDDEVSCVSIYTKKGKKLYLDPISSNIYEPEGDSDEGTSIGKLIELTEKDSTISFKEINYGVLKKIYYEPKKSDYYYDVLNNNLFDDDFNHIGKVFKKKNSDEYTITFKK